MRRFFKFNKTQLEKTSDLLLDVGKTILLGTVAGLLIPGTQEKVGLLGALIGLVVFVSCYLFSMRLIKQVK